MIQNLDTHLNKLQTQCDYLRCKLSTFPEGELSIQKNGAYHRWVIKKKEQSIYCPKSNRSLAETMALKKYYSLLLTETEEKISLIRSYLKKHEKKTSATNQAKSLFSSDLLETSSPYYDLLQKYFSKNKLPISAREWCSEAYETNPSHPENLIHTTLAGHMVRSKSEVIISNLLYTNQIPYRYEAALLLKEFTTYPDFTILHPVTNKIMYWEHFGMMDNMRPVNIRFLQIRCNRLSHNIFSHSKRTG